MAFGETIFIRATHDDGEIYREISKFPRLVAKNDMTTKVPFMSLKSILFSQRKINGLMLKNRIMRSATYEALGTPEGHVSSKLSKLYTNYAKGGVGLIVSGAMYTDTWGRGHMYQVGLINEEQQESVRNLISEVHQADGLIAIQLNHAGLEGRPKLNGGQTPFGPTQSNKKTMTATKDQIYRTVESFIQAGKAARACGADAVQLHSAHGYLLGEFLSPLWNKREDEFGGDVKGRFRIVKMILEGLRSELPSSYPIFIKMNGHDVQPGGITTEIAIQTAKMAVAAGCDALEISSGSGKKPYSLMGDMDIDYIYKDPKKAADMKKRFSDIKWKPHFNLEYAKEIKKHVNVPIICVGGWRKREEMENAIKNGYCDIISLSRPFIREVNLVRKLEKGEKSTCIACNRCFFKTLGEKPMKCYQPY